MTGLSLGRSLDGSTSIRTWTVDSDSRMSSSRRLEYAVAEQTL
jgi:hypothetical protein